ncbi:MAG: glycosyltransferase family 39 protein [Chloroflexi bacterium]|nr:glycosyltransferase family 39 protein [Chloroflexota bacterium]
MKYLNLIIFSLIGLVGAGLVLIGAYSLRGEQVIAVGELGDAPFISGFYHDEAGAIRYRWTSGNPQKTTEATGVVNFPVRPNSHGEVTLKLQLGAALDKPFEVTVLANGIELGRIATLAGEMHDYSFKVAPEVVAKEPNFRVELKSATFIPGSGDTRALGVKVQEVRLSSSPGLRLPPLDLWLWGGLYSLAMGAALFRLTKRVIWSAETGFLLLLPWLVLPYLSPRNLNLWYTPYLLPFAAVLALLIALFAWRKETTGALWNFPARLEEGQLAKIILLLSTLVYLAFCLNVVVRMDYIGHADYADNGVVARNLIQGRGLSADYAAQFYTKYPSLPRPADTWPPLQPFLTVPFFLLFGPNAVAAKLPNLLLMGVLAWAIFYYGSKLFNRRTALGTALLCLATPAFFETVAYPINDLSFTLLMWLSLVTLYRAATFRPASPAIRDFSNHKTGRPQAASEKKPGQEQRGWHNLFHPLQRPWLWAGLWSGLLFLSKPSGGIILAVAGLWLLYQKFTNKELRIAWRGLLIWGGLTLLIISPLMVRNLLQFQTPFYSTEQRDVWLMKYYPPDERIYDLYYTDPTRPLPVANHLLLYGFDTIFQVNNNQFTKEWNDLLSGNYLAPLLWVLLGLGLLVFPRRQAHLVGLVSLLFVAYLLFINLYWHYEIRYFMAWLPWCYAFGLYGLNWIYDKIRAERDNQPTNPVNKGYWAIWVVVAVFLVLWLPGLQKIADEQNIKGYTGTTGIVTVAQWLKQNTPKEARVMSRNIWELSFHSERQGVMIPNNASLDEIKQVMGDYGVRYLQLDHTNLKSNGQPDESVWNMRPALWPLIARQVDQNGQVSGFKKVYEDQHGFIIYELAT